MDFLLSPNHMGFHTTARITIGAFVRILARFAGIFNAFANCALLLRH